MTDVLHQLSLPEAAAICGDLLRHTPAIEVEAVLTGHRVHLYPQRAVTTAEEVAALGAFIRRTPTPVIWHEPEPT